MPNIYFPQLQILSLFITFLIIERKVNAPLAGQVPVARQLLFVRVI